MAPDRPDEADDRDPDARSGDGTEQDDGETDNPIPDRNPDNDALTIPSVATENAGSGLWSDLKADLEIDSIEIPEVSNDVAETDADEPAAVAPDASDAPPELVKTFWALVLVVNAAVLAASLGVLVLVFEGATIRGGALLAGGAVLFGFAVRRYRNYRRSADRSDTATEAQPESAANDDASATPGDTSSVGDASTRAETSSNRVAEQRSPDDSDSS